MTTSYPTTPTTYQPIPSPTTWDILKNLGRLRHGPMYNLLHIQQLRGDISRIFFGRQRAYFINHPSYIQHVLQDNNRNYIKPQRLMKSQQILGNGLLTSDGDFWRQQRRLIQPAFHRKHINQLAETMTAATATHLDRWASQSPNQPFDVAPDMMQLTLEIVTQTLFSTQLSSHETARISAAVGPLLHYSRQQVLRPFGSLRNKLNPTYRKQIKLLDNTIYGLIAQRRATPTDNLDLLNLLLAAQDEETGRGMDDKQLRDEALTIFLAGHETTANLLTWTWMLLSQHPTIRDHHLQEIDTILNGRTPTPADLPSLPYTRAIIDESLRLYPPAWLFLRQSLNDDVINNYHIPADSLIFISPYVLHRHPAFWANPEGFDPHRFIGQNNRPRYAYAPFGGGPRLCIGQHFAIMEATLIITMISQRYTLNLHPGQPIQPTTAITMRPQKRPPHHPPPTPIK